MLYVFYGTDGKKVSDALTRALGTLQKRAPHAHVMRVTDESETNMQEILGAQGLFYNKRIVVFDDALTRKETREEIFKHMKEIQESEHIFFIKEAKLHPAHEKKLKTYATKIQRHDLITHNSLLVTQKNDFALANAFGSRERAKSWLELHRALARGAVPEALHGMLFWKAKDMLVKRCESVKSSKAGGGVWSKSDLENVIGKLAELPHESRHCGVEMKYALERFLLSV